MHDKNDREELERRLEQARPISFSVPDALTKEQLTALAHDIEEHLKTYE